MHKTLLIAGMLTATAPVLSSPSDAASRSFFSPTVGGDRLSFCVNSGDACGKPIADAWCRAVGFEEALNYQRNSTVVNRPNVTRYADTGAICTGADCESFRQIKCFRAS